MHSSRFAVAAVLVVSLAACSDATAPGPLTQVNQKQGISTMSMPFDRIVVNQCNGELVELAGNIHVTWRASEGGFAFQSNYQNVTGHGLTSNASYRSVGMEQYRLSYDPSFRIFWKGNFMLFSADNGSRVQVTLMYTFEILPTGDLRPGLHDVVTTRCTF